MGLKDINLKEINIDELIDLDLHEFNLIEESNALDKAELKKISNAMILNLRYKVLNFCSCGRPDNISYMIRDVLKAIQKKSENLELNVENARELYDKEIMSICGTNTPHSLIYEFMLNVLDSVGLIEHGSSLTGAWLTSYGENMLFAFSLKEKIILDEKDSLVEEGLISKKETSSKYTVSPDIIEHKPTSLEEVIGEISSNNSK